MRTTKTAWLAALAASASLVVTGCASSGGDGASSIKSVPDAVLGKAMTSRMFVWWASSAAQRSMPRAIPPCGGGP